MAKVKTFKELLRQLERMNDPFAGWPGAKTPRGVFRVPVKHIAGVETPFLTTSKKYARRLKDGEARTVPPIGIYVNRYPRGKKFAVLNGHHRLKAHRLIGRKTIKVQFKSNFSEK